MKIDKYSFGSITIDGKAYSSDIIIFPNRVQESWWRKEGHRLQRDDLDTVVAAKPDVIVVGTGAMGVMKVPDDTLAFLKSHAAEVHVARTGEAVDIYNAVPKDRVAVACLHLTC